MTARHPTIGGKARKAVDRPLKPQPAGLIIIACDECQTQYSSAVAVGPYDLYKPCDCGAIIHLTGRYDGYNIFPGHSTIEKVVPGGS